MNDALEVWIDDTPAGDVRIERRPGHQTESMTFSYRDAWLADSNGFAISPDLPLRRGPQVPAHHRSTFIAFDDAAPDAWGRSLIDASTRADARATGRRPRRLSEIDLLLRVNDTTRQGALRFRSGGEFLNPSGADASVHDLAALVTAAQRFDDTGVIDDDMRGLVGVGSSPGGARPKALVHDDGQLLLAKFPRTGDLYDVSAWEDAVACMMTSVGIHAISTSTIPLSTTERILLTPRFDRQGEKRIPYASFRAMFNMPDGERSDYATLADAVSRISAAPIDDAQELFARAVFNALVNSHDDHMRNHGFLRTRAGWRLAPAFDVNPSNRPGDGTPLVPGGDAFDRDPRELVEFAATFRLSENDAAARIRQIASAIAATWRDHAVDAGVDPDALDSMAPAFARADSLA